MFIMNDLFAQSIKVKTGLEVLIERKFDILRGLKVGLVTNQTGVDSRLNSTIDILFQADSIELTALYSPEHGVRGDIEGGEKIGFYKDAATNLPVYSLYGENRKPTSELLEIVDVIVYDIQDIGCRSYTFISTMGLVMEAAAENNKKVIVLDRPNPLGGLRVEGSLVEDDFVSFISQFKIPYVYGLTCGELAVFLNEEEHLKDGIKCDLEIVPMEGWKRNMTFEETGLPWVMTSPHIPHKDSPFYYVASGIVGELRNTISIGVGYTIPFQTFAAGWIDAAALSKEMNSYNLPGVIFRPVHYSPYYAFAKGESISGVQIHILDFNTIELMKIQFYFLQAVNKLYPGKMTLEDDIKGIKAFDKALGSNKVRELFRKRYLVEDIHEMLRKDTEEFKVKAQKYWLYN